MTESDKFSNITVVKPKNIEEFGNDPNLISQEALAYEKVNEKNNRIKELEAEYTRKQELLDSYHKNSLWFVKVINWLTKFLLFFLPTLSFVILPASVICLDNEGALEWIQAWSVAFISSNTSIGLAIGALIASALLQKLFEYVRKNRNPEEL